MNEKFLISVNSELRKVVPEKLSRGSCVARLALPKRPPKLAAGLRAKTSLLLLARDKEKWGGAWDRVAD